MTTGFIKLLPRTAKLCNENDIAVYVDVTFSGMIITFSKDTYELVSTIPRIDMIYHGEETDQRLCVEIANKFMIRSQAYRILNEMYGLSANKTECFPPFKLEIKNVIFNGKATIVFWGDGDKTVVKCNNEENDPEKGLSMAIAKKFLGTNKNKSDYYDIFKKWIKEEKKDDE